VADTEKQTPGLAAGPAKGIVRRIYNNLGLLLGGKAAAGLISLTYLFMATRMLGPTQYGELYLLNSFAVLIGGLIAFPAWHAIVRFGVRSDDGTDHSKLIRLLRFAGAVEIVGGIAAVLVAAVLAPLLGPRLGWSAQTQALALPFSFAVLATVRTTPAGFLQLIKRFDLLGLHQIVTPIMRLIGTLIVFAFGWGLTGFVVAWLIAALVECISLWVVGIIFARRHFGEHALLGAVEDVRHEHDGLMRFMVAANADIMLSELVGRVTPLIMGWVLGPAVAGLYSVAHRMTIVIAQPAQILGQAAYAELTRLVAEGGTGHAVRQTLVKCIGIAMTPAVPLLILLMLFSPQIVTLAAGPEFVGAAGVMIWLGFARVIAMTAPPTSSALIALGRPDLSVTSNMITSVGLLPALPLLTSLMGLAGAGLHAVIQALIASALLAFFLWRQTRDAARPGEQP
jgi:O-antigen/teichoic acid export membrane protein